MAMTITGILINREIKQSTSFYCEQDCAVDHHTLAKPHRLQFDERERTFTLKHLLQDQMDYIIIA